MKPAQMRFVLRCRGCGRFMRQEEKSHGGKREAWHDRCAMRAEERREFKPEEDHAKHEQVREDQNDIEW